MNKKQHICSAMLSLVFAIAAAENNFPVVQKIYLPQRPDIGNTGIKPIQPIDDAAWIWYPDLGNVQPVGSN
jgi:hypothetical protein